MTTPDGQHTIAGAIHMHSDYSHDGHDSLEQLKDACIARGIRFVGMTDHAEDFIPEIFSEFVQHCDALSDDQVTFIPGLEFRFSGYKGMHLLALGLREWIEPKTPEDFCAMTNGRARFTILAHPVLCKYNIAPVVLEQIDAIEVWNGNYNTRYLPDPRSIDLVSELRLRRPELVATVGLDQHNSKNDREIRVLIDAADLGDPLAALQAGHFTNLGRTMHFDAHASLPAARLRRLRAARHGLDMINRVHERTIKTLRRIGIA
jgi:hypothetical protein